LVVEKEDLDTAKRARVRAGARAPRPRAGGQAARRPEGVAQRWRRLARGRAPGQTALVSSVPRRRLSQRCWGAFAAATARAARRMGAAAAGVGLPLRTAAAAVRRAPSPPPGVPGPHTNQPEDSQCPFDQREPPVCRKPRPPGWCPGFRDPRLATFVVSGAQKRAASARPRLAPRDALSARWRAAPGRPPTAPPQLGPMRRPSPTPPRALRCVAARDGGGAAAAHGAPAVARMQQQVQPRHDAPHPPPARHAPARGGGQAEQAAAPRPGCRRLQRRRARAEPLPRRRGRSRRGGRAAAAARGGGCAARGRAPGGARRAGGGLLHDIHALEGRLGRHALAMRCPCPLAPPARLETGLWDKERSKSLFHRHCRRFSGVIRSAGAAAA
jgi:hypothetical protein